MTKKKTLVLLAFLVLVTGTLAVIHQSNRPEVEEGTMLIEYRGNVMPLSLDRVTLVPVEGILVNGKGEEMPISGEGFLLSEVLKKANIIDFQQAAVTAADEYSAVVTAEEIAAADRVYLMKQEEGGIRLVVFGDSNSKRNVTNVMRLSVE